MSVVNPDGERVAIARHDIDIEREVHRRLTRDFATTKERKRLLVIWRLHALCGMTHREIGDVLGHSGGHVTRLYNQALEQLREHFEPMGGSEA